MREDAGRSRHLRRVAASTLIVLGAGWALGCGRATSTDAVAVDYRDRLFDVEPGARLDRGLRPYVCRDETHLSRIVHRPLKLRARIDGAAELRLTACLADGSAVQGSELAIEVVADGGAKERLSYAFGDGWRSAVFDLSRWRGQEVSVRVAKRLAHGSPVFLRDFALRIERPLPKPRPAVKRVVLISLDTFRDDALDPGSTQPRTPELERLLAGAERFQPSWSAEISTKPSHASMLTGLPASVHGCDRLGSPIVSGFATLPERLQAAGIATGGFANQPDLLNRAHGFARGFDLYRNELWSTRAELRAAMRWITAQGDRPFFAFVHLYAAHADPRGLPYESAGMTRAVIARRFGVDDYGCLQSSCGAFRLLLLNSDWRDLRRPGEGALLRALYDAGIETLDRDLGDFFADLRRSGLWDETLVVLTGDHGEGFDEHGYYLHSTPHEEILRVPLIVKWPRGRASGRVDGRGVTALDIAPTVLSHFGLEAEDLVGHDLATTPQRRRLALFSYQAARWGGAKLLLATRESPLALYDLVADPQERHDLAAERQDQVARLASMHDAFELRARKRAGELRSGAERPFTPEEIEQLRSLGYLQ